MAIININDPVFHLDDPAGGPLVGGKVYVYASGTTNALTAYKEQGLTNAHTQPITLDAYGNAKIWIDADAKIVVWNSAETVSYYTFDNISVTGGTSTITGDYNLVQNGSFESGTGIDVTGWTLAPNDSSVTIGVDTTNVSHGKQSLKFDGLTSFGGGTATSAKFDVTAGANLQIALSYMVSNATTTNLVQLFWYQKNDTASGTPSTDLINAASGHPTSMTLYEYIKTVPSDATRAEIKITGIDSGGSNLSADAYFDNVRVYESVFVPATLGTVQASKVVMADSSGNVNFPSGTKLITGDTTTVSGADVSSITLGSLTFTANTEIEVSFDLVADATGSAWANALVLNGDTTATNYYHASSTDIGTINKGNSALLGSSVLDANDTSFYRFTLSPNSTTGETLISYSGGKWDSSASAMVHIVGTMIYKSSAVITSVGIRNSGSDLVFAAGSRISARQAS